MLMVGMCRLYQRKTTGKDGAKKERPPTRVAVFPIDWATGCRTCGHRHRMTLYISDCGSSNDIASIIGGALVRIFQALRNQIDHNIPSCTPAVYEEEDTPQAPSSKGIETQIPSIALGPDAWQDDRSLPPTDTPARGSLPTEICRAF